MYHRAASAVSRGDPLRAVAPFSIFIYETELFAKFVFICNCGFSSLFVLWGESFQW